MNKFPLACLVFCTSISVFAAQAKSAKKIDSTAFKKTDALYQSFLSDKATNTAQLNLFFKAMPKGGDLHHHFSGSIYAETYLDWADSLKQQVDTIQYVLVSGKPCSSCMPISALRSNARLYGNLLQLWSDKDFQNHYHEQLPPDQNFFQTFGHFGDISKNWAIGLKTLKDQAQRDNVSYIETMIGSVDFKCRRIKDSAQCSQFDSLIIREGDQSKFTQMMGKLQDNLKDSATSASRTFMAKLTTASRGIDEKSFKMRYQTYASRGSVPSDVFAALYAGFLAVTSTDNQKENMLVGVNLVSSENSFIALRDYTLHMNMISYLKTQPPFKNVNVALHAGELTLGMVPPKDLEAHIFQALFIAKAQRIGHGVDLPLEANAFSILDYMKRQSIPVEINLTSNEFILGVKNEAHPYTIYRDYGVPIVISTDDAAVSRNNLANEYMLLASRYKPSYATIKKYVKNSITYSFLPGTKKDSLTTNLDTAFAFFEKKMADYSDTLKTQK